MIETELFNKFFSGGAYSLPYLIQFTCEQNILLFVNSNEDVVFNNNTFKAATFEYIRPDIMGDGGSLKISGMKNSLIEFLEDSDNQMRLDVVGILLENGDIEELRSWTHMYGTVTYNDKMEISFTLESDDRLKMTFPPYKFDTDNNRGNA